MSRHTHRRLKLAVAILFVIVVAMVIGFSGSGSGGATYKAQVVTYTQVNPADLSVAFRVTNTGHAAGDPTCTINAQDPSGAYSGFNSGTLQGKLQPGQTVASDMQVVVTHQGAGYVTQVTVSCS